MIFQSFVMPSALHLSLRKIIKYAKNLAKDKWESLGQFAFLKLISPWHFQNPVFDRIPNTALMSTFDKKIDTKYMLANPNIFSFRQFYGNIYFLSIQYSTTIVLAMLIVVEIVMFSLLALATVLIQKM